MASVAFEGELRLNSKGFGFVTAELPSSELRSLVKGSSPINIYIPRELCRGFVAGIRVRGICAPGEQGPRALSLEVAPKKTFSDPAVIGRHATIDRGHVPARDNRQVAPSLGSAAATGGQPRPLAGGGGGRTSPTFRLVGFLDESEKRRKGVSPNTVVAVLAGGQGDVYVDVGKLGCADQILAAQPGAEFELSTDRSGALRFDRQGLVTGGDLVRLSADVCGDGMGPDPDVSRNPYNFADLHGAGPWEADDPQYATHDKEHDGRRSGWIEVSFEAMSPLFVPSAIDSGRFFQCSGRKAIPGSTVKGVVRSLFEALTNARAGITDEKSLKWPSLYRRRSSRLFKVTKVPQVATDGRPGSDGEVIECRWDLLDSGGRVVQIRGRQDAQTQPDRDGRPSASGVEIRDWRANLLWVEPNLHQHQGKKKIAFVPRPNATFVLPWEVLRDYLRMKGHPHLEQHPANVRAKTGPTGYVFGGVPDYSADVENDLFRLAEGDILFAIPKPRSNPPSIACFGKNVNFLWPAPRSPLEMLGDFRARCDSMSGLSGADSAEVTFGFAGVHDDKGHHPFRGRVRFGTFWAEVENSLPPVRMMTLTAPSGSKCKARPLYLADRSGGGTHPAPDHGLGIALRGRKFYWHQRTPDGGVAPAHAYDRLHRKDGPELGEGMASGAPTLEPLGKDSLFQGRVQFENLTDAELGALLAALSPDLVFGSSAGATEPGWGIKVGKGKPRGLGSVKGTVKLHLLQPATDRYRTLDLQGNDPKRSPDEFIVAYRNWCLVKAGQSPSETGAGWRTLPFVRDLEQLLRLPSRSYLCVYPPRFEDFGWLPGFDRADGRSGRPDPDSPGPTPPAMPLARDIEVP